MALNNEITSEFKNISLRKNTYNSDLEDLEKEKNILENKIEIINNNILNNEKLPQSIRNILNNPRLKGIHNTIGNLIQIPNDYELAASVVLGNAANFLIVDNENNAKDAIN